MRDHLTEVEPETITISVITLAELRYGAAYSARPAENHQAIDDFVSALTILGVTSESADVFGKMKANLRKEGILIDDLDLLIAATAHAHDLTLVTNNEKHFSRIANLRLANWVKP